MKSVTVRVPGSSANLGPGFDSLGVALSIYNTFTFTLADKTSVTGCDAAYCGEDNLAIVAFRAACDYRGVAAPAVSLAIFSDVPVSRGLGSSSTLFVGGILAADTLLSLGLSKNEMLVIANGLEGHPDNVAPAIFGGITASMLSDGVPRALPLSLHPSLKFCAFIPDFETKTRDARAVLPRTVPFTDAVYNASRVAVLIPALAAGDTEALALALSDKLHEPYRKSLIHEFSEVETAAKASGAVAFFISGSGSTLMALYTDAAFPERMREKLAPLAHAWRTVPLTVDKNGAKIV